MASAVKRHLVKVAAVHLYTALHGCCEVQVFDLYELHLIFSIAILLFANI